MSSWATEMYLKEKANLDLVNFLYCSYYDIIFWKVIYKLEV